MQLNYAINPLTGVMLFCLMGWGPLHQASAQIKFGNGFKIGEVTQDSAVVWIRLTTQAEMLDSGNEFLPLERNAIRQDTDPRIQIPDGLQLSEMNGSVQGRIGEAQVLYWRADEPDLVLKSDWMTVDSERDFTRQIQLDKLSPGTEYGLRIVARETVDGKTFTSREGSFRTPAKPDDASDVNFVVVTCGDYQRRDDPQNGHRIYRTMLEQIDPDFFVHTGDIEYYDKPTPYAIDESLARFKWNRLYALPYLRDFHCQVTSYFLKDDHDTVKNDCWKGAQFGHLTWDQGISIFQEQFPYRDRPYRTVRWGKDVQIWLVEGRDFRSPNNMEDGPEKTIWGAEQKEWFFKTVTDSDATFKVLISPTPVVGPDRTNKNDNHANRGFKHEGDQLREFIGRQENMFVICGDRHWQYFSIDLDHGVHEFSCGPSSNRHAGGYSENKTPLHQYLKVAGGFLSVSVETENDRPTITFRHHAPDGEIRNEYSRAAESP